MISAESVYVDFEWESLFGREIRLKRVFLAIPEVTVVRNAAGAVNFEEVKHSLQRRATPGKGSPALRNRRSCERKSGMR